MENENIKRRYICKDGDMFDTLEGAVEHNLSVLLLTDKEIEETLWIEEWFTCYNCGHRLIPLNHETEATHYNGGDIKCLSPDEDLENLCGCKKPQLTPVPSSNSGVSFEMNL